MGGAESTSQYAVASIVLKSTDNDRGCLSEGKKTRCALIRTKEHVMTNKSTSSDTFLTARFGWWRCISKIIVFSAATLLIGTLDGRPTHAASLADLKATWIGWSSIKISEPGFDFGGETFVAGAPTDDGWIDWFLMDGQLTPSLTGHLHLHDVRELCARMRVDYYVGGQLWTTKYGGQVCADDDKHHEWDVLMNDYSSSKIDEVRISIEKLTASKDWTIVGSQRRRLSPVIDTVKISEDGFDFGGQTFAGSGPTNSGKVVWTWSGAQVSPRLTGTLHVNNAATACARMRIEYFKDNNSRLAEKVGGSVCAPDNKHHAWDVDLEPYSNNKLAYIKIGLQTLGADDVWRTVGSTTSSYVRVPAALCGGGGDCIHSASARID